MQSTHLDIQTHAGKTNRRLNAAIHFVFILMLGFGLLQAETYDLETFLNKVETHSKDLKLAKKDLDMAKVYKKEAVSTALPEIRVDAAYKRNLKDIFLYIDFPDFETGEMTNQKFKINYRNEYGLLARVSQTVFSFKVGNALKAAKQYKKLTDFIYHAKHQTIVKFAKKAFYQTLLLRKVWEVSKASEENAHGNYLDMKKKFDHGQVSQFKLLQAEARWQNVVPETTRAKRNYELALNTLKNMAGIPAREIIELEGDFDRVPAVPVMEQLDTVLDRRPDFNALVWEEKLRTTGVKSERANRLPSLSLDLIYNFSSLSDYFKLERQNHSYIIGLNLSIPIFTGGYMQAQVKKAKIELEKARIKIDKEKETIYNELVNIYLRLEEAHKRIQSAKKTLETAKKAFEIAEVTAANGLATQLELKDARVVYDQARLNRYAAAYDYLDAYFDWQQAVGVRSRQ
ncbi:MAG: TolC family protein [Candidatus Aminicenantes bacterium]|nr:TolC family protein [Candidatus Aminicenantes bacterium]NIM82912.1 TolC family protein [Candidatus Aminicenantes bacterium]NIN22288.1 TolC family protein [Candidatus Aminicenantes bacterium]NIN46056.1 TolC family protein [Candidatus Aminicenantes bacterium]NIN88892.1 TolC family protein [Candidatus Aminicenantes bacterium]